MRSWHIWPFHKPYYKIRLCRKAWMPCHNTETASDRTRHTDVYRYCSKCRACIRRCPAKAVSISGGKDHAACSAFINKTKVMSPRDLDAESARPASRAKTEFQICNIPKNRTCTKNYIYPIHESGGAFNVQGYEKDQPVVVKGRY